MTEGPIPIAEIRAKVSALRAEKAKPYTIASYCHDHGTTLAYVQSMTPEALAYANLGWKVLPVKGKIPRGNNWQNNASSDPAKVKQLFGQNHDGIGVKLGSDSGIIDVECDDVEAEETLNELFEGKIPKTPKWGSTRGSHRLFRFNNSFPKKAVCKIGKLEFRTGICNAAQSVLPPSGGRRWIDSPVECEVAEIPDEVMQRIIDRLPKTRRSEAQRGPHAGIHSISDNRIKRARAWLEKAPGAVSGQRGHDATIYVAVEMIRFGLDRNEALSELLEWNQRCDPPWTDAELLHKIDDAIKMNPEPKEDRPRAAAIDRTANKTNGSRKVMLPNESPNDPHRLARLFLKLYFTRPDGLQTLVWWQGTYWTWSGLKWQELKKHEVIAKLTACVKAEFDRINVLELEKFEPKNEGDKPPQVQAVTKTILTNVDNAVASLVSQPDSLCMPDWLCINPLFPAREVLATTKRLLHLPSLLIGKHTAVNPTPMLFSANALAYEYDNQAECSNWMAFLNSVWGDDLDSIRSLQEWFGYLLLPDTRQHKLLMLIGPTRSGKGTITRVLHSLLGEGNVASPTLSSLAGPFGLWPLLNKFVALIPDARLSGRDDSVAIVERMLSVTGEDPQDIHRKNLPTLTGVRMPIRFVLMSNELPNMKDASGAFMARVFLLRMTRSFLGCEDKSLGDRLNKELPGILNWAIAGWSTLNARGNFEQPESANELLSDLANLSSPIMQFIADACHTGPAFESTVETLYAAWKSWCETNHHDHTGTSQTLGKNLRAALPQLDGAQRRIDGSVIRVYRGIGVRLDW